MGTDWIPCRIEPGCSREQLSEHVRREAAHFRIGGGSHTTDIDPRVPYDEAEAAEIRQSYQEFGPLHRHLLLKIASHRIYVITWEELFPIEWRLDSQRTILPWELPDQIEIWQSYRRDVASGMHRPFLRELYVYDHLCSLKSIDVANFVSVVESSRTSNASWAARPEVASFRDEILSAPLVTRPLPPQWPHGGSCLFEEQLKSTYARVDAAVTRWNEVVQRGNKRAHRPKSPLEFEAWIAYRLKEEWFGSFLDWAKPWVDGGYGLYRNNE